MIRMQLYVQEQQKVHFSTLRLLKICMCNVDKCKVMAMRSCNIEIGFGLIDILYPNKTKEKTLVLIAAFIRSCQV